KHSAQIMDHRLAFLGVKVQQDLRVSLSAKPMSLCFERRTQLLVIVDFPIKGDDELAVGAHHRLRPPFGEVNDRQPAMPEAHTPILRIPLAKAIWSARGHIIANALQLGAIHRICSVMIGVDARNATHEWRFRPAQLPFVCNSRFLTGSPNSRPTRAERRPSKHCW